MLPSLFEGLPVVLVEAQTAGLPCFVSDTVDAGAAFTDRVKFLPLNDVSAWTNTIAAASFRRDPQAREKAVKAGYDIHTSAQVLQQFLPAPLCRGDEMKPCGDCSHCAGIITRRRF